MPISPLGYNRYSLDVHEYMGHPELLPLLLRMSPLHTRILHAYAFHSHDILRRNGDPFKLLSCYTISICFVYLVLQTALQVFRSTDITTSCPTA